MNKREREHNLIYVLFLYLDPYKIKICYSAEFHFTLSAEKSRLILPKNVLAWVLCHLVGGTPLLSS